MINTVVSNIFQMVNFICIIITSLPQSLLNETGRLRRIISVYLLDKINIISLLTFIKWFVFDLIIKFIKLCVRTNVNKNKHSNKIHNLIHISHHQKKKNLNDEPIFLIDDELKDFFKNEINAYHVTSNQSEDDTARHFINQIENDDPFFIADVSHCAKQYLKWTHYFPHIKPFYAVKTNGNSFLIKTIEKMGGGFDCASIEELESVLSVCPNIDCSTRIIYAHPCKLISHIKYFKDRNVEMTVVDNESELIKLKIYWSNAKILLRLKTNDSKSFNPLSKKFGVSQNMIIPLFQIAKKLNLNLIGCSFHVGTGCYDVNAFKHALIFAKQTFDISNKLEFNFNFRILNIGGGFPGIDEYGKPSFAQMSKTINQSLNQLFSQDQNIFIMAEPGRYFSTGYMNLITSIISYRLNNKNYFNDSSIEINQGLDMNNIENVYYISDGIYGTFSNILYENTIYNFSYLRKQKNTSIENQEKTFRSAIFGPTCDSSDCLSTSINLPLLEIGDHLLVYNIGAYSNACSTRFNGFYTKKYFYIWKDT